jgi:hypothetical protein
MKAFCIQYYVTDLQYNPSVHKQSHIIESVQYRRFFYSFSMLETEVLNTVTFNLLICTQYCQDCTLSLSTYISECLKFGSSCCNVMQY